MNDPARAIVGPAMLTAKRVTIIAALLFALACDEHGDEAPVDPDPYDLFAPDPCASELALDLNGDGETDLGWCRYDCAGPDDAGACPSPLAGQVECADVDAGHDACVVRCDPGAAQPCADNAECLNVSADNFVCTYVSG